MNPLQKMWLALEDIPGAAAVLTEWRHHLGPDFKAVASLLQPTDELAASYPDADDPYSSYRVVSHGAGDFVGVHDRQGEITILTKRDVLIYRMDHRRVFRRVIAALEFERYEETVDGVPHTARIGTFRPFAGFEFPVYVTIPLDSADLLRVIEVVLSRSDRPFILITPTGRRLRPIAEALLKQRNACFLTLAESITTDATGKWTAARTVSERLTTFRRAVIPQATESNAVAFFPTPATASWSDLRIKFIDGETVSIKIASEAGTFVYSQMGMADGRSAKPTKQWDLLRSFAKGYGVVTWRDSDANRKNQKRRESLARNLKAFFRIDSEPIVLTDDKQGWRTIFSIEPDA